MTVGTTDQVRFAWTGTHDVFQVVGSLQFTDCVQSGGTTLSALSFGGSYDWDATGKALGVYYFICTPHCSARQKVAITVAAPGTLFPTTFMPTNSPTTLSPTTLVPTNTPTTVSPTTLVPSRAPTSLSPTTLVPSSAPTTLSPTTLVPSHTPTTLSPTTPVPTYAPSPFNGYVYTTVAGMELAYKPWNMSAIEITVTKPGVGWIAMGIAGTGGNAMVGGMCIIGMDAVVNPARPSVGMYDMSSTDVSGVVLRAVTLASLGISGASFSQSTTEAVLIFVLDQTRLGSWNLVQYPAIGRRRLTTTTYIFASGPGSGAFTEHPVKVASNIDMAAGSGATALGIRNTYVFYAHVAFALIAFGFIFPTGASIAMTRDRSSKASALWFGRHWQVQSVAFVCLIIAIGLGSYIVERRLIKHLSSNHTVVGAITTALICFQVINGGLRVHVENGVPKSELRKKWEILHRSTATLALILGWVSCILGFFHFLSIQGDLNWMDESVGNLRRGVFICVAFGVAIIFVSLVVRLRRVRSAATKTGMVSKN